MLYLGRNAALGVKEQSNILLVVMHFFLVMKHIKHKRQGKLMAELESFCRKKNSQMFWNVTITQNIFPLYWKKGIVIRYNGIPPTTTCTVYATETYILEA